MAVWPSVRRARVATDGRSGPRIPRSFPRRPRRKTVITVAIGVALAVFVAACSRTITHEPGAPVDSQYDQVLASTGQATYQIDSTDRAFAGSRSAKASFTGAPSPPTSKAYGGLIIDANTGVYSAALYFPNGTLSGASPLQRADMDVMRWEAGPDFGGIRISGSDHRARLVRSSSGGGTQAIGESFRLQEGCWNWVAVRQKLSDKTHTDPNHAENEVWLNGRKVVDSWQTNRSTTGNATNVRFGLPYIDAAAQGNQSFHFYVDDVSVNTLGNNTPTSGICTPPKPNVLYIVTDDHPPLDTMHAMPNTTKWFRDGARRSDGNVITGGTEFTEGYATTPLCCPGRASILSGRMAHNHGVRNNGEGDALSEELQVQTYLDNIGYQTGLVGKYLNDFSINDQPPGFDKWWHFAGYGSNTLANDNGTVGSIGTYGTTYVKNKAIDFLDGTESNDSDPWFLYLAPIAPHEAGKTPYTEMKDPDPNSTCWNGTYQPPAPAPVPSRNEGPGGSNPIDDKPKWVRDWTDDRAVFLDHTVTDNGTEYRSIPLRDQMLRALCSADQMVDAVFNRMKELGEERDTLAFFVADNGYMLREHGMAGHETFGNVFPAYDPQEPNAFRYIRTECVLIRPDNSNFAPSTCGPVAKNKPYEESIKIPFYMRWPANINSPIGVDAGRYVGNIDLTPTVVAATGASAGPMDGRSLYDRSQDRGYIVTEGWNSFLAGTWAGVRGRVGASTYHYIEYYEPNGVTLRQNDLQNDDGSSTMREFYDLTNDPYELNNLLRDGNPATPPATVLADAADRLRRTRLCEGSDCLPSLPPPTVTDSQGPRVWIMSPQPFATISGTVEFQAGASDNLGIQSVELWRDSQLLATDTAPPYLTTFDASTLSPGAHTLKAVARDAAGHSDTQQISVNVQG